MSTLNIMYSVKESCYFSKIIYTKYIYYCY